MRAITIIALACVAFAQQREPELSKDAISVHEVRRGTMPLREILTGSITSTNPGRATISTERPMPADALRAGQPLSVQTVFRPPRMIPGTVERVIRNQSGTVTADVAFSQTLPDGVLSGAKVAGGDYVKRVPVKYGRQSDDGDSERTLSRVTITRSPDMSAFAGRDRVRLK